VFLDGRVSIQLEAQNELQRLQIVNRFDAIPDVPVSSFQLTIRGGRNGILRNFDDLCEKRIRGQVSFTAHSGKTFGDKPVIETPGCVAAATPRVGIALRGVRGGKPVLSIRARRAPAGARLRALSLRLPRSLRVDRSAPRDGVLVKASRRLGRSKLTRKGVLKVGKLPRAGVSSITAVLRKGVLSPRAALRRRARGRRQPTVTFRIRITDAKSRRFNVTRKVRARR
jgi:hypothetical protein